MCKLEQTTSSRHIDAMMKYDEERIVHMSQNDVECPDDCYIHPSKRMKLIQKELDS